MNGIRGILARRYERAGLWKLFLIAALPHHLWTILLWLRDFGWIAERTDVWDAIGVGAYGLVLALGEGFLVFVVSIVFGLLLPGRWKSERRVAVLAALILLTAGWEITGQAFFVWELGLPGPVIRFYAGLSRPLVALFATASALAGLSLGFPVLALVRWDAAVKGFHRILDGLSMLSSFYLVFDVLALIMVGIRNLS